MNRITITYRTPTGLTHENAFLAYLTPNRFYSIDAALSTRKPISFSERREKERKRVERDRGNAINATDLA